MPSMKRQHNSGGDAQEPNRKRIARTRIDLSSEHFDVFQDNDESQDAEGDEGGDKDVGSVNQDSVIEEEDSSASRLKTLGAKLHKSFAFQGSAASFTRSTRKTRFTEAASSARAARPTVPASRTRKGKEKATEAAHTPSIQSKPTFSQRIEHPARSINDVTTPTIFNPFRPYRHTLHPSVYLLSPLGTLTPLHTSHILASWSLPTYAARIRQLRVSRTAAYFDRRVTCIEWHPDTKFPAVLAMGSKGGDLVWWDYEKNARHAGYVGEDGDDGTNDGESVPYLYGRGPGGSITAMRFHPTEANMIYTTSIDGTVRKQDFEGRHGRVFLDTLHREKWYTALDISPRLQMLMVGSNTGYATLADMDGCAMWSGRLHKAKCHDVEFHPVEENVVCTAGNDRVVKLWDLRMMKKDWKEGDLGVPLNILEHEGVVTAATFSTLAPYTLLTTSQDSQCRLYDNPLTHSSPSYIMSHPHRPFQHLTAIRATWSPVHPDLFVIGRYPDTTTDRRTVDVFRFCPGLTGVECVARIGDSRVGGIQCLAKFNRMGDVLATCSGFTTYVWTVPSDTDDNNDGNGPKGRPGGGGPSGGNKPSMYGRGDGKGKKRNDANNQKGVKGKRGIRGE
ncbi:hypothetical protein SpCBS45565_g06625 [Spizellomyces sp. 'palustris']|nr:hypothetical protein SpCBS45565_g06625 [Spizellomyces sp. 'palustris']